MAKTLSDSTRFAIIAWVLERKGADVAEIAKHFMVDEQAVRETIETFGGASFGMGSPDQMVQFNWDDFYAYDRVYIVDYQSIGDRIDLSDDETIAFILGLSFLSELLPEDLKETATNAAFKLRSARNLTIDLSKFVIFDHEDVAALREQVMRAISQGASLRFDYVSGSGDMSSRNFKPVDLSQVGGHWIVEGHDLDADSSRNFRLDRMSNVEVEGVVDIDIPAAEPEGRGEEVRVIIDPTSKWAVEGRASVKEYGSRTTAIYNVLDSRWMENQLLLLGSGIVESSDKTALLGARERARQAVENRDAVRAIWHT
ncbi:MAG: WYL domain-containing protein [Actinomycetaceae bacterium]|nr:WYL domain-containing protein [Actinomycetaceae bacterium]